jgi:hypothetical protein
MGEDATLGLVLWATDIPALSAFIEAVGGFAVEERHPGYASLLKQGARIVLHDDESYRGHPWFNALRKEGVARGIGAEIDIAVDDVAAAYQAALRLGGLSIQPPYESEGREECHVMGPDGYVFSCWRRHA